VVKDDARSLPIPGQPDPAAEDVRAHEAVPIGCGLDVLVFPEKEDAEVDPIATPIHDPVLPHASLLVEPVEALALSMKTRPFSGSWRSITSLAAMADFGVPCVSKSSADVSTSSRPAIQSMRPRSGKLSERAHSRKRSRLVMPAGISIPSGSKTITGAIDERVMRPFYPILVIPPPSP
jgi:hypothetical protein